VLEKTKITGKRRPNFIQRERRFFQRRGSPDAIDVGQMMKGDKGLRLPRIKRAVLAVHPDSVVAKVGGELWKIRHVVAERTDAGDFSGANFF
jgi:hypothetical protein